MKTYLDFWTSVATALFSQALAGAPELTESQPGPLAEGGFGFAAILGGEIEGRFSVVLDAAVAEAPLLGEGVDQKAGWGELLREVAEAAAGELLAETGKRCRVENFEEIPGECKPSRAFQLRSGEHAWTILVQDEVRAAQSAAASDPNREVPPESPGSANPGVELLLDVELEASLRFGCRVQLDRHVADPVDLIVGDKIVARGEVVLVNGNFGLRVTEVATPRKRLESIRCLF
jgi:flagellar motor switch/type III secretory pathway protein FliN